MRDEVARAVDVVVGRLRRGELRSWQAKRLVGALVLLEHGAPGVDRRTRRDWEELLRSQGLRR